MTTRTRTVGVTAVLMMTWGCAGMSPGEGPRAVAELEPRSGTSVRGRITFTPAADGVRAVGEVTGHTPGRKGFHIHDKGDCSAPDAMSAGGHYNPTQVKHGAPGSGHLGDLGNLVFDGEGRARVDLRVPGVRLDGTSPNGIVGRALIVHVQEDDLRTDPTGNAGGRAACGLIRMQ